MSFPVNYETAMTNIANLAMDQNEPGYVRVRALIKLVSELSPLNERHLEVKRELNIDEAQTIVAIDRGAEARAYMQGLEAGLAQAAEEAELEAEIQEEDENAEEDDDPL